MDVAGRLVFLGKGGDAQPPSPSEVRGAGYFWKHSLKWEQPEFIITLTRISVHLCNYIFHYSSQLVVMDAELGLVWKTLSQSF